MTDIEMAAGKSAATVAQMKARREARFNDLRNAATLAGCAVFNSARCPKCGGRPTSMSGRDRTMVCGSCRAESHVPRSPEEEEIHGELFKGRAEMAKALLAGLQFRLDAPRAAAKAPVSPVPAPAAVVYEPQPEVRRPRPRVSSDGIAEIALEGDIDDISADGFIEDLAAAAADGARFALVTITTRGGSLSSTARMVRAAEAFPGRLVAHVPVQCSSAGTLVMLACDYAIAETGAQLTIHGPSGDDAEIVAAWRERILDTYSSGTGLDDMTGREWFNSGDRTLDVHAALSRHFVDDIGDKYQARAIAERFAAGRPPVSSRAVLKAIHGRG